LSASDQENVKTGIRIVRAKLDKCVALRTVDVGETTARLECAQQETHIRHKTRETIRAASALAAGVDIPWDDHRELHVLTLTLGAVSAACANNNNT
jgi:hypothetical protein